MKTFLVLTLLVGGYVNACPVGFTYLPEAGRCYNVVFETHDWNSAAGRCQMLLPGSHLVAIETATENVALKDFLAAEITKTGGSGTPCSSDYWPGVVTGNLFWTSGQRNETNCGSPFVWKGASDPKVAEFTDWYTGEPNCASSNEFCMDVDAKKNFAWNDVPCSVKICPVCEYNPSCF